MNKQVDCLVIQQVAKISICYPSQFLESPFSRRQKSKNSIDHDDDDTNDGTYIIKLQYQMIIKFIRVGEREVLKTFAKAVSMIKVLKCHQHCKLDQRFCETLNCDDTEELRNKTVFIYLHVKIKL